MGPRPRLLGREGGISRGKGRSRLLGREPREEGGLDTLGLREGRGLGLLFCFEGSNAGLTLHVGPGHFFEGRGGFVELMALGGVVVVQRGDFRTKGDCHAFIFGRPQVKRGLVGGGPRGRTVRHVRMGEVFLHLGEGRSFHGGHL